MISGGVEWPARDRGWGGGRRLGRARRRPGGTYDAGAARAGQCGEASLGSHRDLDRGMARAAVICKLSGAYAIRKSFQELFWKCKSI